MQFLLLFFHVTLLSVMVIRMRWFSDTFISKKFLVALLLVKTTTGILAGSFYLSKYGGGDTYAFFHDGLLLNKILLSSPGDFFGFITNSTPFNVIAAKYGILTTWLNDDPLYNDNRTIVMFHAALSFISFGSYSVHVAWFAFFSLAGQMGLYRMFRQFTGMANVPLVIAIFLVPSVVLWTSVASKESIALFATGLFCAGAAAFLVKKKLGLALLTGLILSFLVKVYLIVLLLPALIAWKLSEGRSTGQTLLRYCVVFGVFTGIIMALPWLIPGADVMHLIYMKRINFEIFAIAFPAGFNTYIQIPPFEDNWFSLLLNTPAAIVKCLIQPLHFSVSNLPLTVISVENIFLLMVVAAGIVKCKKTAFSFQFNTILFCVIFTLCMMSLIGLTTPVAGVIIRYKALVIPFMMMIPVMLMYGNAISSRKFH